MNRRDELERLRRANPAPAPPPAEEDPRADAVLTAIVASPVEALPPRGRSRRLALALALVVVLVGGSVATAALVFDFRDFPPPADVVNEPRRLGPKYVVTRGVADGLAWRLVTYRSTRGLCSGVEVAGTARAAAAACGQPPNAAVSLPTVDYIGVGANRTWLYGRVTPRATRVTLTLADGRHFTAATYRAPAALALPFRFYVATVAGGVRRPRRDAPAVVAVVARDAAGLVVASAQARR